LCAHSFPTPFENRLRNSLDKATNISEPLCHPLDLGVLRGVGGVGIRVAPTIGNVMIDTNTSNQLTVSWTTDVATQGTVYYSASPLTMVEASANTSVVIGGTAVSDGDGMTANHSATITGLTSGTTQYILIRAVDAQGDESVTTVSTVSVR
jgi:hypothetical protein